ncbi:MAG: DUF3488 domain-containing protein [Acidobacteria bacterium]|nr:MAG: DUF3488 domain-containing protein [Acidobacteriota bacterium]
MSFERAFRLYSYLLLLAGFFALFASGAAHPLVAGLYLLAVLAIARWGVLTLSHTVQLLLVLGMLGWCVVEIFLFSPVIQGLVHLLLLISLLRLLTAATGRDYMLLYLISFVFVLLASTYTISAFFLLTLAVFIFFAIQAFMLFESRAAYLENRRVGFSHKAYLQMSATVTVLILLFAIPIFVVIPRGGMAFLGNPSDAFAQLTGFSDRVVLGDLGRILTDARIVMRVKTDLPVDQLPEDVKWRGIALDHYDGRVWSNTRRTEQQIYQNQLYSGFLIPRNRRQKESQLRQVFFVEPFTNIVFGAPDIISISGVADGRGFVVQDGNDSFSFLPARARRTSYTIYSDIVSRGQRLAAIRPGAGLPAGMAHYLQLPEIDVRIRNLAEQLVANKPTPVARALALEDYLHRNYRYSLENASASAADPVADFLFQSKAGHCEYFSASLAIMLRSIGIPCRVVNGFRSGEFNSWSDHFVVRQSDAHSWVEAYFEGAGWMEFDATPPGGDDTRFLFARLGSQWLDALDAFWTEVITFDRIGQVTLFRSTGRELFSLFINAGRFTDWIRILRRNYTDGSFAAHLPDIGKVFWVFPGGLLAFAVMYRYRRYLRLFVKRRILMLSADRLAPDYYLELLDVLKRRGLERRRSETPLEFASRAQARLDSVVPQRVTELYYGNRFGRLPLAPSDVSEIYSGLKQLRKLRGVRAPS